MYNESSKAMEEVPVIVQMLMGEYLQCGTDLTNAHVYPGNDYGTWGNSFVLSSGSPRTYTKGTTTKKPFMDDWSFVKWIIRIDSPYLLEALFEKSWTMNRCNRCYTDIICQKMILILGCNFQPRPVSSIPMTQSQYTKLTIHVSHSNAPHNHNLQLWLFAF